MNSTQSASIRLRSGMAFFGAAALLAVASATAQVATSPAEALSTTGADPTGSTSSERASCIKGMTQQAEGTCLTEARNAAADKRRGVLDNAGGNFKANRYARCDVFKGGEDRAACVARIDGEGQAAGTVAEGGVVRQVETVVLPAGADRVIINPQTPNPVILTPARNAY
jgi:hypothetical protein